MKCGKTAGAVAQITADDANPNLRGRVRFLPHRDGVLVVAQIEGLPENDAGFFGFHIHEGASCGGSGFGETGGHYDPAARPHPRHAGDLPPLLSAGGRAFLSVVTDRFCVEDIVGKTIVIHEKPDDFTSSPAGNAGGKIACGEIHRM